VKAACSSTNRSSSSTNPPHSCECDGAAADLMWRRGFRIVCLAGSAGALSGYRDILRAVRPHCGMAFIVVSHRRPGFDHLLHHLLQAVTDMPVSTIVQGQCLALNSVVLLPSDHDLAMLDGRLVLTACEPARGWPRTVTTFLRSLALDAGSDAVAVILSGLANDGSAALGEIKRVGGATFAQADPKCPDMPMHAIETGHVDFVLSSEAIGLALSGLSAASHQDV
jgi:two-component system, chemotaxis family, CheB/CheR fusion protein